MLLPYSEKKLTENNYDRYRFQCTQCNAKYNNQKHLDSHNKKYHQKCHKCNLAFMSIPLLQQHNMDIHGVAKCEKCDNYFSSQEKYKKHLCSPSSLLKEKNLSKCNKCQKLFSSDQDMKNHLRYNCSNDFKNVAKEEILAKEVVSEHLGMLTPIKENNTKSNFKTIFFLNCEKCNLTFQNALEFTTHQTSSNCYEKCDKCDRRFMTNDEKISHKSHKHYVKSNPKHSCMYKSLANVVNPENISEKSVSTDSYRCSFQSCTLAGLNLHTKQFHFNFMQTNNRKTSNNETKINKNQSETCDRCMKIFKGNYDKLAHINSEEYKKGTIAKCSENYISSCQFMSCTTLGLQIHFKNVHQNNGSFFKCDFCDMEIHIKEDIEIHQKSNFYGKPLSCDLCEYKSCDKFKMMLHQQSANHQNQFQKEIHQKIMKENEIQIMSVSDAGDSQIINISGDENDQPKYKKIRKNIKCDKCSTLFDSLDKKLNHESNR